MPQLTFSYIKNCSNILSTLILGDKHGISIILRFNFLFKICFPASWGAGTDAWGPDKEDVCSTS